MRLFGDKRALAGYLAQVVETHLLLQKAAFKRTVQTHWGRGRQPSFSRFCLPAWAFQPQGKLGYWQQVVETHLLTQKAAFKRTDQPWQVCRFGNPLAKRLRMG